ncbi:hypothetical protein SADUNF_Sadunf02G0129900 [Salix dunnii]|uniref:SRP54-type proteins GTP-binding domain-containing protein n=1 Tax=Salix dunnii TaxID=1413687 RepID=A0A835N7M5_9ROSI|nr:hypothetical protein SADUNF_Sadunf02G0129900 [Salix dunnii]
MVYVVLSGNRLLLRCVIGKPAVVMIAGVNGGGKTSSLGKLAYRLRKAGEKVIFCLLFLQCDKCLSQEYWEIEICFICRAELKIILFQLPSFWLLIWHPKEKVLIVTRTQKFYEYDVEFWLLMMLFTKYQYYLLILLILMAAGDTYRAAYSDQLEIWAEKAGFLSQALKKGKEQEFDIVLSDTSGCLRTNYNLMKELIACKKVMGKIVRDAPNVAGVTGFILTKLDGYARSGRLDSFVGELGIPVKLMGVEEGVEGL